VRLNLLWFTRHTIVIAAWLFTAFPAASAQSCGINIKPLATSRIMFVNGIGNDERGACLSSSFLESKLVAFGIDLSKTDITYFHNPSLWLGADVNELRQQASLSDGSLLENTPFGTTENYYQILGRNYKSWIFFNPEDEISKTTSRLYAKIVDITTGAKKQNLIVVPHSQGNFYMEAVYAMLKYDSRADVLSKLHYVGVASVARHPPGNYVSATQDRAVFKLQPINASAIGLSAYFASPSTFAGCFVNCSDPAGDSVLWLQLNLTPLLHEFVQFYLNRNLADSIGEGNIGSKIYSIIKEGLDSFRTSGSLVIDANRYNGATFGIPRNVTSCRFNASGTWTVATIGSVTSGPTGIVGQVNVNGKKPGSLRGALVYRKGTTLLDPYDVTGTSLQIDVTPGQVIEFSMDEGRDPTEYANNGGALTVNWTCSPAGSPPGAIINPANGHGYEVISCGTWSQCKDAATAKGGTLVTIRSQAETDWLITNMLPLVNSTRNVWIGYFRATAGGAFQWASGELPSFEKWFPGEPNNAGGNENCTNTIRDATYGGYWNDIRCDHPDITQAIVEYWFGGAGVFNETFSSTTINATKWTNNGYTNFGATTIGTASIDANGIAQFPAWSALNTKGKVIFSGSKIVIEARMAALGSSGEARMWLAEESNIANQIMVSNTPYCNWGLNIQARGIFKPSGTNGGCGADIPVPFAGGWTNQFMEYRWTIDGSALLVESGPTLTNITQTLNTTLGSSIAGKNFFLTIGTGATAYSPGAFDWIRVNTTTASISTVQVNANNPLGTTITVPSGATSCTFNASGTWNYGYGASSGADGAVFNTTDYVRILGTAPWFSLIAKTSSGYIPIGSARTVPVTAGQSLAFMINEGLRPGVDSYLDNSGALSLTYACN
jgi:Lectin C-type domain